MSQAWDDQVQKSVTTKKEPSLFSAINAVFFWEFVAGGFIIFLLEFLVRMTQPLFIGGLVSYYSAKDGKINEAYLWAAGIVLCTALNTITIHPYMLGQSHLVSHYIYLFSTLD